MKYMQILECNSTLTNCCSDFGLMKLVDIARSIFDLIQLIVPILLMIMATVQLIKMMANPDEKKNMKGLINKFLATAICFFLPTMVDTVVGIMPNTFQLATCWEEAKVSREVSQNSRLVYMKLNDKNSQTIIDDPKLYDKGEKRKDSGVAGVGAAKLINIAIKEIGNHEGNNSHAKYENYTGLSLSDPWCAAFVTWCAGQAGYIKAGKIPSYTWCLDAVAWFNSRGQFHTDSSGYMPQPGDIVFFGPGGGSHTGIVEKADKNNVYTIEGNTSCQGEAASKCGGTDGVSRKTRPRHTGYVYGFGTPKY